MEYYIDVIKKLPNIYICLLTSLISLGLFCFIPLPTKAGEWCGARGDSQFAKLSTSLAEDYFPREGYYGRQARFLDGCKEHDKCYWHLDSDRQQCDDNLRKMLVESCENAFNEGIYLKFLPECKDEAESYYLITNFFGFASYISSQDEAKRVLEAIEAKGVKRTPEILTQISELCSIHTDKDGICLINFVADLIVNSKR